MIYDGDCNQTAWVSGMFVKGIINISVRFFIYSRGTICNSLQSISIGRTVQMARDTTLKIIESITVYCHLQQLILLDKNSKTAPKRSCVLQATNAIFHCSNT